MERQPHNLPHEDELLYDDGRDAASVAPYGAYSAELTGHALGFQSRTAGEYFKRQFFFAYKAFEQLDTVLEFQKLRREEA
jgi:hypothetical protein